MVISRGPLLSRQRLLEQIPVDRLRYVTIEAGVGGPGLLSPAGERD